jgi:hypothetical protein
LCQILEVVWMGMSVNELLETRLDSNIQAYRGCGVTVIRPMSLDHTYRFDVDTSPIGCKGVMNWVTPLWSSGGGMRPSPCAKVQP